MTRNMWTRRSVMTGVGAVAATLGLRAAPAYAQTPASGFRPARHQRDEWLDQLAGQHRVFIDSAPPPAAGAAVLYANNLFTVNSAAYSIDAHDLAIVVCFRHFATPFGYNDAMWAKYGELLSGLVTFTDPRTDQHPSSNLSVSET